MLTELNESWLTSAATVNTSNETLTCNIFHKVNFTRLFLSATDAFHFYANEAGKETVSMGGTAHDSTNKKKKK